jgi:hypothetical protein
MIAIMAATANSHHLTARFGGASYAEIPVIEPVLKSCPKALIGNTLIELPRPL